MDDSWVARILHPIQQIINETLRPKIPTSTPLAQIDFLGNVWLFNIRAVYTWNLFSVFKRRFQVYGFVIVLLNRLNSKIQVMFVLWCVLFRNDLLNICMHAICCFCVRVVFISFLLIFDRYCLTQARLTRGASCRLAIMGSQLPHLRTPRHTQVIWITFFSALFEIHTWCLGNVS